MYEDNYIEVLKKITAILEKVIDIAMPVIGDISIYSKFVNFSHYVQELGFKVKVKVIPGIHSFIAAADSFNLKALIVTTVDLVFILSFFGVPLGTLYS